MLGPTLMKHGTPPQRERHLTKILTAEEIWCQGFSEPNAGSDLANLQTRAVLDGDHYVINGQKVWTSMAHVAEWGFFLVRSDPNAAKHKGITFILVDMKTPGISIRPLTQITGEAEFNEVFLDNVRVPATNVVGKVNEGWGVALTTLAYERDVLTMIRHISLRTALERLVALARRTKKNGGTAADDPVLRQKIAGSRLPSAVLAAERLPQPHANLEGQSPGPEGSTSKLFWSQVDQDLAEIATEVIGPFRRSRAGASGRPTRAVGSSTVSSRAGAESAPARRRSPQHLGERVLGLRRTERRVRAVSRPRGGAGRAPG
jgi:alkylation response protein AidB-like acyl-CoA dehydrogenase